MLTPLEHILTSAYKDEMIAFMETHPEVFEEAITLAVADKQPYSWRAAWLLWSCMQVNDYRILAHIKDIINSLASKKDGHQRELLKILLIMEIDEVFEGFLFDLCVGVWEKINKQPSVRLNALKIIFKIAKKHPELSHEIDFLIQDHYLESLSPGVKWSINKMIKDLKF